MNDSVLRRFSEAISVLAPDMPMSAAEIESGIRELGLERFLSEAGGHAAELVETAELISRLSGG